MLTHFFSSFFFKAPPSPTGVSYHIISLTDRVQKPLEIHEQTHSFQTRIWIGKVAPVSPPHVTMHLWMGETEDPQSPAQTVQGQVRIVKRMVRALDLRHTKEAPIKCFALVARTIMDSLIPENNDDYMAIWRNGDIQICLSASDRSE